MVQDKLNIRYNYTLTPEWQDQFVKSLGAKLIDNKMLIHRESIASGYSLFLQIEKGLSVSLLDYVFHVPITFTRTPFEGEHYIAYYDMNEEITTHVIEGEVNRTGYHAELGMSFSHCMTKNEITPPLERRLHNIRLIIGKDFLKNLADNGEFNEVNELIFDESKNTTFFYNHIDSKSKILLNRLKDKDFKEPSFELRLKGLAYHLLYNLITRARNFEPIVNRLSERDIENTLKTSTYMLNNLMSDFPGLSFLADMAEVSTTKYNLLFKKILKASPREFFLKEKILLSDSLLASGNFHNISEVAYELGYSKANYFSMVYKRVFGINPSEKLVRKSVI